MNNQTLLIVEDNDLLREGIRDILQYEGFSVMTAANGWDALEQMKSSSPDMIVSDISMPYMDGFAFFRSVRASPDWVSIPFVFLTAHGDRQNVIAGKHLGAEDYLIKPLTRDELLTAVRARLARSEQLRLAQLRQAYDTSLTMLANAIDVRNPGEQGHVERVAAYSHEIALQLGWRERLLEQLRFGAILHDIGKIIIREGTLFKAESLDDQEWQVIRQHPLTGSEMVKNIPHLAPAMAIIRYHHERWDGQGYPDGLSGAQIPQGARIVALADSFDIMTSPQPYKPALGLQQAYAEVLACAGAQFDPEVVSAFQMCWGAGVVQQVYQRFPR